MCRIGLKIGEEFFETGSRTEDAHLHETFANACLGGNRFNRFMVFKEELIGFTNVGTERLHGRLNAAMQVTFINGFGLGWRWQIKDKFAFGFFQREGGVQPSKLVNPQITEDSP